MSKLTLQRLQKLTPKSFGLMQKSKTSSSTIGDIKDKDTIICKDEKTSAFCRYFSSVFTIEDNSYPELNLADPDPSSSVIEFDELDLNRTLEHIRDVKIGFFQKSIIVSLKSIFYRLS